MSKHTPGPWELAVMECKSWSICTVYAAEQGWVEIFAPDGGTEDWRAENSANARLIAAAPDMLNALHALCDAADDSDGCQYGTLATSFVRDIARAAITKATGGSA